jgi:membrane protease YdiL (CAAX protease family)
LAARCFRHGWRAAKRPDWRALQPLQAVALGIVAAVVVLGASLVLDPLLPKPLHAIPDPGTGRSALNGLLASFYGGIAEELQLRLFLMTLLVWLMGMFGRRQPRAAAYWVAIVVAAILFGAGHLAGGGQDLGPDRHRRVPHHSP